MKTELVRPEQMTGSYELCMLIDGVVKQFPTVAVEIDMPFYKGHAKALCMDHPVQALIIGNIPGALGLSQQRGERTEVMVRCNAIDKLINGSQNNVTTVVDTTEVCDSTQGQCDTLEKRSPTGAAAEIKRKDVVERPLIQNDEHEEVIPSNVKGGAPHPRRGHEDHDGHTAHEEQGNLRLTSKSVNFDKCSAVQTRAMKERELKPLKVSSIDGLEIGPEQLIEQQRSDETLKRYWKLVDELRVNPVA